MVVPSALPAPPQLGALCKRGAVAVFLDFDGTLVDLAELPDAIHVPDGLGERLGSLASRLGGRLALVSGRGLADLERHLGDLEVARAGSHGISRMLADGSFFGEEPEVLPPSAGTALQDFAAAHGFTLEQKPHGAALHYRAVRHLEEAGIAFVERLAEGHGLQVKRGNCVIELVQPGADKGAAVRAFMQVMPFAGSHPVFLGDDLTDEDGFAAAAELGGFGILVGDRQPSAACYRLPNTLAVHEWLGL